MKSIQFICLTVFMLLVNINTGHSQSSKHTNLIGCWRSTYRQTFVIRFTDRGNVIMRYGGRNDTTIVAKYWVKNDTLFMSKVYREGIKFIMKGDNRLEFPLEKRKDGKYHISVDTITIEGFTRVDCSDVKKYLDTKHSN